MAVVLANSRLPMGLPSTPMGDFESLIVRISESKSLIRMEITLEK